MKNFETVEKKLGFGAMRLPMISREEPDMAQIEKMVDAFMANGGRYFDSAFTYLHGLSESILGKALVARYPRDSFLIATKTPMFEPVPQEELVRISKYVAMENVKQARVATRVQEAIESSCFRQAKA